MQSKLHPWDKGYVEPQPLKTEGAEFMGKAIPIKQLMKLNQDLNKYSKNRKRFYNVGDKLMLGFKQQQVSEWYYEGKWYPWPD